MTDLPTTAERREPREPRWRLPLALAVALLVVLVLGLAGVVSYDDRPRAGVGDVLLASDYQDPLPHRAEVLLPWARLEVGVGEPQQELPPFDDDADADGAEANLRRPVGGSFVQVDAAFAEDRAVTFAAVATPFVGDAGITLRADGVDYPLDGDGGLHLDAASDLYDSGGSRWVAVAGTPSDLEVLITVDGVTQVIGMDGSVETGGAAALSDLGSPDVLADLPATRCSEPRRLDRTGIRISYPRRLPCRVDLAIRLPYVDGLGWAGPGRAFLVVQAALGNEVLSLESGRRRDAEFWEDGPTVFGATLDGAEALGQARVNELNAGAFAIQDVSDPSQFVFDVPDDGPIGELVLHQSTRAEREDRGLVLDRATIDIAWTVPAGELG